VEENAALFGETPRLHGLLGLRFGQRASPGTLPCGVGRGVSRTSYNGRRRHTGVARDYASA